MRGLAMYLTLAFAVRLVLYESSFTPTPAGPPKHAQKSHIGSNHQEQLKPIGRPGWLFLVVSPSYWFADTFKQSLCSDRKRRFLQECNWFNIAASLVILILLDVLDCLGLLGGALLVTAKSLLVYRVISRVIEITVGFYKDVVVEAEPRCTGLCPGQRISLAIHSYFDIIALYAAVYFAVFPRLLPCRLRSPVGAFLYSCSVSSFNFSLPRRDPVSSFLVLTQMFASLNLVVLSVASYITMKGEERPRGGV